MLSDNERLARSTIVSTSFYIDFQHFRLLFISSQQRNFSPYSISFNDLYCHRSMLLFSYLVVSVCAILFISSVTSKWIEYFLLIRGSAFINTHRRRHHLHWYVRRDSLHEQALCSLIGLILIRFDASTTYRHFYLLRIVFFSRSLSFWFVGLCVSNSEYLYRDTDVTVQLTIARNSHRVK